MRKRLVRDGRVYLTSSASNTASACVGVSVGEARTGVLDTKNPGGEVLEFSRSAFTAFLADLRTS
ncbi:DUF397 domain-containing protein [Actinosynnema sp. NPDC053489]|uniref:DUF397 domain-containing protein n=1 Tax=Actinosynnema sp. NPDC053489 TaxID=3363916 RepID=UPI0037C73392